MHPTFQLVFAGEILAGYTPTVVREAVASRLKLDDERLERLFSGEPVVLKRGVELDRALHYVAQFEQLGALLHIEDSPPPAPPRPAPAAARSPIRMRAPPATPPAPPMPAEAVPLNLPTLRTPVGAEPAVPVLTITCPDCGERQPPAPSCRACHADLLPARRPPPAAAPAVRLLATDLEGRMGRQMYARFSAYAFSAAVLLGVFVLRQPSGLRLALGGLGLVLLGLLWLRWGVLRCHDLNRNGWWSLPTLVPGLGLVASMALSVMPGTDGDNDYGEPTPPGSTRLTLVAVFVAALLAGAAGQMLMPVHGDSSQSPIALPTDTATAFDTEYAPGPAHKAFAVSRGGGWGWKTGAANIAEAIGDAMTRCEANRPAEAPVCQVINVDGRWVRNH